MTLPDNASTMLYATRHAWPLGQADPTATIVDSRSGASSVSGRSRAVRIAGDGF